MTTCTYISGLICLTANNMHNPHHETFDSDKQLVDAALQFVDEIVLETNNENLRKVRDACRELTRYVLVIVQKERHREMLASDHLANADALLSIWGGDEDEGTLGTII